MADDKSESFDRHDPSSLSTVKQMAKRLGQDRDTSQCTGRGAGPITQQDDQARVDAIRQRFDEARRIEDGMIGRGIIDANSIQWIKYLLSQLDAAKEREAEIQIGVNRLSDWADELEVENEQLVARVAELELALMAISDETAAVIAQPVSGGGE